MKEIQFGQLTILFTSTNNDPKPKSILITIKGETLYFGTPDQFYRMLRAFKIVSQEVKEG